MKKVRWFWLLGVALLLSLSVGLFLLPATPPSLPDCSKINDGLLKPVEKEVRAAVLKYYQTQKLTPIRIDNDQERVMDVKLWTIGTHSCLNPDGGSGAYVGAVPKNAKSAVQLHVYHKPYPVTQNSWSFVMLAEVPTKGWIVVSEGTGP